MTMDEAIELSMKEVNIMTEVEAMERRLKWSRELIMNRGKKQTGEQVMKQVSKQDRELAMKQAMMN